MSRNGYAIVSCKGGEYLGSLIHKHLEGNPGYYGLISYYEEKYDIGEIKPSINNPVRGKDLYFVQSLYSPTVTDRNLNDNLIALCLAMQAAKIADADKITAILPYLGYSRQERRSGKEEGRRESLSAKYVADMFKHAGADRIVTLDVHAEAIEGFYGIPFDNIYPTNLIIPEIKKRFNDILSNSVFSSLDLGGMKRTGIYSRRTGLRQVVVYKEKDETTGKIKKEKMKVLGNVKGVNVITIDDIVASGGTFFEGALKLEEEGALGIVLACSHPLFTGNAIQMLDELTKKERCPLLGVIGTNSIWHGEKFMLEHQWYSQIDITPVIAGIIKRIQSGGSLHELLDTTADN